MDNIQNFKILSTFGAKVNPTSQKRTYAKCLCQCGKEFTVALYYIKSGDRKSCGCLLANRPHPSIIHGMSHKKEHNTWCNIIQRCTNPNNPDYMNYGGRGIKICDRWMKSFQNFFEDMGYTPSANHSIERNDNHKGYSPDNCYWATYEVQSRNKRNNHIIEWNNERKTISEWADVTKIHRLTIFKRLHRGWSVEKTLTEPVIVKNRSAQ